MGLLGPRPKANGSVGVCRTYIYFKNDKKVLLKNFKLFRIISKKKKKNLNFFKNFRGAKVPLDPHDDPPLFLRLGRTRVMVFVAERQD